MKPLIDLTGRVFGNLTVLSRAPSVNLRTLWNCRCACGTERPFCAKKLRTGKTKSCGCQRIAGIKACGIVRTLEAKAPSNVARKLGVSRVRYQRWRKNNPERARIKNALEAAKRRASKPRWADAKAIYEIYAEARRMTKETGIRMSVDHIYPIKGKNVCGLHVPENLQIIPLLDNIRKGNRFDKARLPNATLQALTA